MCRGHGSRHTPSPARVDEPVPGASQWYGHIIVRNAIMRHYSTRSNAENILRARTRTICLGRKYVFEPTQFDCCVRVRKNEFLVRGTIIQVHGQGIRPLSHIIVNN